MAENASDAERVFEAEQERRKQDAEKIKKIFFDEEIKRLTKELDFALSIAEREVRKQSPNHDMLEKAMPIIIKRFVELKKRGIHPLSEEIRYKAIRHEIDRWT